jgi:phosphoglycerate dehydrogenase-like enzyme
MIYFATLHDTLRIGRIAGAGRDMFPAEPPSPSQPVLALDNVVLTPHPAAPASRHG